MKNCFFVALLLLSATTAQISSFDTLLYSKDLGIYIITLFQAIPQNGLTFKDNLKALQNTIKQYQRSKCMSPSDQSAFNVQSILVKHSLNQELELLSSLKQIIAKYNTQFYPKIILYSVSKESIVKYSKGHKFFIPKSFSPQVENLFVIDLNTTVVTQLSCKFVQIHYQKYLNYFNLTPTEWVKPKEIFPQPSVLPMTGFFASGFNFNNINFNYTQKTVFYFSIMRPNGAFVSRHLMDLYFISIKEIQSLRKLVKQKNECQYIALNFIVGHYYLEIPPYKFNIQNLKQQNINGDPQINAIYDRLQSRIQQQYHRPRDSEEFKLKSTCIQQMSKILGYVPLKSYNSTSPFGLSNWKNPSFQIIVKAKRILFSNILQEKYTLMQSLQESQTRNIKNAQIIERAIAILNKYDNIVQNAYTILEKRELQQRSNLILPQIEAQKERQYAEKADKRVEMQAIYAAKFIRQKLLKNSLNNKKQQQFAQYQVQYLSKNIMYFQIALFLGLVIILFMVVKKIRHEEAVKNVDQEN